MTPDDVAKKLGVKVSSVYNARNGYFKPGRDLAVKIADLSDGAVPVEVWAKVKTRKRRKQ